MSPTVRRVWLADAQATERLGAALATAARAAGADSLLVALRGELGAGKTTLVRGLLRACGHDGPVPSPTYTLLESYRTADLLVHHLDLYRLADDSELEFIGWRDLDDGLRLVEWPERAPGAMRTADLTLALTMAGDGRDAVLEARTPLAERVLDALPDLT